MAKTTFIYTAVSDFADVTASSELSVLHSIEQVQTPYPGRTWRSDGGDSSPWIKFDFGESATFDYICIAGGNFDKGTMFGLYGDITAYATNNPAVFALTSEVDWHNNGVFLGELEHNDRYAKINFLMQDYRYVIIFFNYSAADLPDFTQVGRIVIGQGLELDRGHSDPYEWEITDLSTKSFIGVATQNTVGIERLPIVSLKLFFNHLSEVSRDDLSEMYRSVLQVRPFFIDPYPEQMDDFLYGLFDGNLELQRFVDDKTNVTLKIRELR